MVVVLLGGGRWDNSRRPGWARSARSSPARFPTYVIGPLFGEGTLISWMLLQNASGAIAEWWLLVCRGSVAASGGDVGHGVGGYDGEGVGRVDGEVVCDDAGADVTSVVVAAVRADVADAVGAASGAAVGDHAGADVGADVGGNVGVASGDAVGVDVGTGVGVAAGDADCQRRSWSRYESETACWSETALTTMLVGARVGAGSRTHAARTLATRSSRGALTRHPPACSISVCVSTKVT